MNTGLLRPAVATVLTVYGIETYAVAESSAYSIRKLQQYLPFTVLKPCVVSHIFLKIPSVATVLTVYGIETTGKLYVCIDIVFLLQQYLPFTVLKHPQE